MYQVWITSVSAMSPHKHMCTLRCDSKMIGFIREKSQRKRRVVEGKERGERKRRGGGHSITKYW